MPKFWVKVWWREMSNTVNNFAGIVLKIKMFLRFFGRLCLIILAVQFLVICIFNSWFNHLWISTKHMFLNGIGMSWGSFSSGELTIGAKILINTLAGFFEVQKSIIIKSFCSWILLPIVILYMYLFDEDEEEKYIQGRKYITPSELNKLAHKNIIPFSISNCIPFGAVYLPRSEEIKQTFVVGKPGSGKTNAFNHMIEKIRNRHQKLIIHDYKGDYVEKFYTEGDLIFNPLDKRSIGWCLFNDCKSVMDIDAFAAALIPDAINTEPYWNNAARDILIGILHYCYNNNLRTNRGIWQTVCLPNLKYLSFCS